LVGFVLSVDFGSETTLAFLSSDGGKKTKKTTNFFSMHKLKTYVSESIMYGNDNFCNCLLIPSRPDYLSFFGFEHLYTFALGSINNSDTDRK